MLSITVLYPFSTRTVKTVVTECQALRNEGIGCSCLAETTLTCHLAKLRRKFRNHHAPTCTVNFTVSSLNSKALEKNGRERGRERKSETKRGRERERKREREREKERDKEREREREGEKEREREREREREKKICQ